MSWIVSSYHMLSLPPAQTLKKSDVILDVNGTNFEADIFINDWVYELKIGKCLHNHDNYII